MAHNWFECKEPMAENFARAFELLGHETRMHYYNDETGLLFYSFRALVNTPLQDAGLGMLEYYREQMTKRFIRKVEEYRPDFVFVVQASHLSASAPKIITSLFRIPIALWVIDDPLTRHQFDPFFIKSHFNYHHIFVADEYWMPPLKLLGDVKLHYLPFAANHEFFKPLNLKKDIDIIFVGSLASGPNTNKSIIFSALKEFKVTLVGPNIKVYARASQHPRWNFIDKFIFSEELNELYNRSKIVLAFHHTQLKSDPSPRTFNAAACKAFQISEFKPNTNKLFNGNIVEFHSPSDLQDKVAYYLTHEEERQKHAEACYPIAIQNHTYVARAKTVLEKVFGSSPDSL